MIKKLLTLIFIIGGLSAKAQQTLHIAVDATYFNPATLEFYKPVDNGSCTVYSLKAWMARDRTNFDATVSESNTGSLEEYLKAKGMLAKDMVLMSGIKKSNVGYNAQVEQLAYQSPSQTRYNRPYYQTYGIINPDYFLSLSHFNQREPGAKSYDKAYYRRFVVIVINNLFTVYYTEHKNYHIVAYNNNFELYAEGQYKQMQHNLRRTEYKGLRQTYPIGTKFKGNGKVGLKAEKSATVLIPAEYDSLFVPTPHGAFISAYKNNRPYLFFRNGQPVPLKNLRAVYSSYNVAVLTGNTISWLNTDGEFTPNVETPVDCGYREDDTYTIETLDGAFILKKAGEGHTDKGRRIAGTSDYRSVRFITGDTVSGNFTHNYYIAETHDGKKGLINPFGNRSEVLIDFDYQTFKFQYIKNLIRVDKNGLSGYWPLNKVARYTRLAQFDKGFARFTLPDGTQGWLAMDGTEYLDQ